MIRKHTGYWRIKLFSIELILSINSNKTDCTAGICIHAVSLNPPLANCTRFSISLGPLYIYCLPFENIINVGYDLIPNRLDYNHVKQKQKKETL